MRKLLRASLMVMAAGLLGMFAPKQVQASHIAGTDMSYIQVAPGVYLVTLNVYRDCIGITMPATIPLDVLAPGCGTSSVVTLPLVGPVNGIEISDVCPGQATACSTPANNSIPGLQQYRYSALVYLPNTQCANWTFSYDDCCRNADATNICPNQAGFRTEAIFDNTITGTNSSPVFGKNPIPYVCVNDTVQFNPQVSDPDGDSLVFAITNPLAGTATAPTVLQYCNGSTLLMPFGPSNFPTSIDPVSGQIIFKPQTTGAFVIVVRVQEYRKVNGVPTKIGTVQRDIQVQVVNCTTPPPTVNGSYIVVDQDTIVVAAGGNGFISAPINIEACAPQCLEIKTVSSNPAIVLALSSEAELQIPGATWSQVPGSNPNFPIFRLCWTPTVADVSTIAKVFTLTIQDNACPFPNAVDLAIRLVVQKTTGLVTDFQDNSATATPPRTGRTDSICVGDGVQMMPERIENSKRYNTKNYPQREWTATDLAGNAYTFNTGPAFAGQFPYIDTLSALFPTVYVDRDMIVSLKATSLFGCEDVISDTIFVKGTNTEIRVFPSPQSICFGDSITFADSTEVRSYSSPQLPSTPYSILWTAIDTATNQPVSPQVAGISDPTIINPTLTPRKTLRYVVTVTSARNDSIPNRNTCVSERDFLVTVGDSLVADFKLEYPVANLANPLVASAPPIVVNVQNLSAERLTIDSVQWILFEIVRGNRVARDTIAGKVVNNGIWQPSFDIETEGTFEVQMRAFDLRPNGANCNYTASRMFSVEPSLVPNVITPNNDGQNDKWQVKGRRPNTSITIYNRWGQEIKKLGNSESEWDPKDVSGGLYYYMLEESDTGKKVKGWINVLK